MQLVVLPSGSLRCLYGETIPLQAFGLLSVARGSHVEPDHFGQWFADLSPVSGPKLGPFTCRSHALQAEQNWLEVNWLSPSPSSSM